MIANRKRSILDQICLFVCMAILTVIVMAVKIEGGQNQGRNPNEHQNQTEGFNSTKVGISSVNETGGNLTLDFNSGDLAFEREKTKHELIIPDSRSSWKRFVECRGKNIKSLSAISCDTLESCEEKKSQLFEKSNCKKYFLGLTCGWDCGFKSSPYPYGPSYSSDYYTDESGSSCFRVEISIFSGASGIVQCTSQENGVNLTTFDHYNIGNSHAKLLSNFKNATKDLIMMRLFVASLTEDLNANSTSNSSSSQSDQNTSPNANSSVTLFVDEEITSLVCQVPKLLTHATGLIIRAHRKDGSTVKLESKMTSWKFEGFMKADLNYYRVPADLVAFSCSAQRTNSSDEWLENRINVTIQDLPSEVIVKTGGSRNLSVNLTSGANVNLDCQVTGPLDIQTNVEHQMRKMRVSFASVASSNSVIEFLRFYQVAGEHLQCKKLDQGAANLAIVTARHMPYGYKQAFHFIFNLAPSAPKIHNPNIISPSSSVHVIYKQDHVVDQTLLCLFNGEPQPVITWIKNGHPFLTAKSMGIFNHGNETLEHVKLGLDSTTIQPADFRTGNGNGSAQVNFSCVASNYFGSDRLDFIIKTVGELEKGRGNSDATTTATMETTTTIVPSPTTPSLASSETTTTIQPPAATNKPRETQGGNLNLTTNSNSAHDDSAKKSNKVLFLTISFALCFILIVIFYVFWKERTSCARLRELGSASVSVSGVISPFQNHCENEGYDSTNDSFNDESYGNL